MPSYKHINSKFPFLKTLMSVIWAKMIVMKLLPHALMLWGERIVLPVPVRLDTQAMVSPVQVSANIIAVYRSSIV